MKDRSSLQIFTEIGFGNPHFVSTEIEKNGREKRIKKRVCYRVTGIYLRIWIGRRVAILSTRNGFEIEKKTRSTFKLILGCRGSIDRGSS